MRTICETIVVVRSENSGREFFVAQLSGDTDMVTDGWVSLSSATCKLVVIARLADFRYDAGAEVEQLLNQALARHDLRVSHLVAVERMPPIGLGRSFQAYRNFYRSPRLFFKDITGEDGVAVEVSRMSLDDFEREGGQVLIWDHAR